MDPGRCRSSNDRFAMFFTCSRGYATLISSFRVSGRKDGGHDGHGRAYAADSGCLQSVVLCIHGAVLWVFDVALIPVLRAERGPVHASPVDGPTCARPVRDGHPSLHVHAPSGCLHSTRGLVFLLCGFRLQFRMHAAVTGLFLLRSHPGRSRRLEHPVG